MFQRDAISDSPKTYNSLPFVQEPDHFLDCEEFCSGLKRLQTFPNKYAKLKPYEPPYQQNVLKSE